MEHVIILNGDYSFLNTVHWKRAVILLMNGKAEALKYSDKYLHLANGEKFKIPIVMRLIKIIRMIYKNKVPYSKKNVFIRDKYKCVYCGSYQNLTIDHVIPISQGGKSTFENCVTACRHCNNKKNNKTPFEAKMFIKYKPYTPTISEFFINRMNQLGVHDILKDL